MLEPRTPELALLRGWAGHRPCLVPRVLEKPVAFSPISPSISLIWTEAGLYQPACQDLALNLSLGWAGLSLRPRAKGAGLGLSLCWKRTSHGGQWRDLPALCSHPAPTPSHLISLPSWAPGAWPGMEGTTATLQRIGQQPVDSNNRLGKEHTQGSKGPGVGMKQRWGLGPASGPKNYSVGWRHLRESWLWMIRPPCVACLRHQSGSQEAPDFYCLQHRLP